MPKVRIKDQKQYMQAIEVLTEVGGMWHGVGSEEWYLLVNNAQYNALVEAKVVTPDNGQKEKTRGRRKPQKA